MYEGSWVTAINPIHPLTKAFKRIVSDVLFVNISAQGILARSSVCG